MKSINGTTWNIESVPERLILKYKQNFKVSYLLSKILLEKKYTSEEIHNSLYTTEKYEIDYNNKDILKAVKLFKSATEFNNKILIFGDYDVDGYSSTYLLYDFIKKLKFNCNYYIPDRFKDGYGPNKKLLEKIVKKNNYSLVFFVDCGSNSTDEILYLEKKGTKTIIIDHHQIYNSTEFKNTVIINPLKNLKINQNLNFCSATLVYFFLKQLNKFFFKEKKINFDKYLFFAAISTICDQMPLRFQNKVIVKNGLSKFDINNFINIKKLINLKKKISSSDIGFNLGPCLNSSSRLGYPDLTIKLLIEKKIDNINKLSTQIIKLNEKRKNFQNITYNHLRKKIDISKNEIIFKYHKNINEGLIGIIAANFVEDYNKPCFILTKSNKLIKCSARSIKGFDIGNILNFALQKKIIIKGGGHSMAGGCLLNSNKIYEFKIFLNEIFRKKFKKFENIKSYSSEQTLESLKSFAKNELQRLEPLGNDNSNPIFLIKNNKIIKYKIIKNKHLQVIIKNKFNKSCLCLAFNALDTELGYFLTNYKKQIDLIVQINNKIIQKNSDFNLIIKDAII
mgnify:CR=1 FL=1